MNRRSFHAGLFNIERVISYQSKENIVAVVVKRGGFFGIWFQFHTDGSTGKIYANNSQ